MKFFQKLLAKFLALFKKKEIPIMTDHQKNVKFLQDLEALLMTYNAKIDHSPLGDGLLFSYVGTDSISIGVLPIEVGSFTV